MRCGQRRFLLQARHPPARQMPDTGSGPSGPHHSGKFSWGRRKLQPSPRRMRRKSCKFYCVKPWPHPPNKKLGGDAQSHHQLLNLFETPAVLDCCYQAYWNLSASLSVLKGRDAPKARPRVASTRPSRASEAARAEQSHFQYIHKYL